jgi:hypothetical protein
MDSLRALVGTLLVIAGVLAVAVGVAYWLPGWRYGGMVLYVGLMFGMMMLGLGLMLIWPDQRLVCLAGTICSMASGVLVIVLELRDERALAWRLCGLGAAVGTVLGLFLSLRAHSR